MEKPLISLEGLNRIFLVPHNRREQHIIRVGNGDFTIKVDKVGGTNEDPYVWSPQFLYTFCHARGKLGNLVKGDIIVFLTPMKGDGSESNTWKDGKLLEIDTLICVDKVVNWPGNKKGETEDKISIDKGSTKDKRNMASIKKELKANVCGLTEMDVNAHIPEINSCGELLVHGKWPNYYTVVGDVNKSCLPMGESRSPISISNQLSRQLINYMRIGSTRIEDMEPENLMSNVDIPKKTRSYFKQISRCDTRMWDELIRPMINEINSKTMFRIKGKSLSKLRLTNI